MMLRHDQDAADIRDATAAHALEARAEAVLRTDPALAAELDHHDAEIRRRAGSRRITRGPHALALRIVARSTPAAMALLTQADALYWAMGLRHEGLIVRESVKIRAYAAREGATLDLDDVIGDVRIGWYHGAIRFDPARERRYPTMATRWGRQYEQRHRDYGVVQMPRDHRSLVRGAEVIDLVRESNAQARRHAEDRIELMGSLADPSAGALFSALDVEPEAVVQSRDAMAALDELRSAMAPRDRAILDFALTDTLSVTALAIELDVSRSYAANLIEGFRRRFGDLLHAILVPIG